MRLPMSMIEQIDKIVMEYPGLGYNRQQFVESAIREKIEKMQHANGNNSKSQYFKRRF